MSEKDTQSPATTSDAYDAMLSVWRKVQTVLDGTEAMRTAGAAYLPQHENEGESAWRERLACSTLFNLTQLTLDSWEGRPVGDPITFTDVPRQILYLLEDVDLEGHDVQVFSRYWFRDGLAKAFSHVLV